MVRRTKKYTSCQTKDCKMFYQNVYMHFLSVCYDFQDIRQRKSILFERISLLYVFRQAVLTLSFVLELFFFNKYFL